MMKNLPPSSLKTQIPCLHCKSVLQYVPWISCQFNSGPTSCAKMDLSVALQPLFSAATCSMCMEIVKTHQLPWHTFTINIRHTCLRNSQKRSNTCFRSKTVSTQLQIPYVEGSCKTPQTNYIQTARHHPLPLLTNDCSTSTQTG